MSLDSSVDNDEEDNVQEKFLALLEHASAAADTKYSYKGDDDDDDDSSLAHQTTTQLCQELLKSIQSVKEECSEMTEEVSDATNKGHQQQPFIRTTISAYNNKAGDAETAELSVRKALGNLPSTTMSKLTPILSHLMSDRVDVVDLLPATQDEMASQDAMGNMAITLTKQAFLAAELYVELIGMPGAWGAGLIDVGTLSGLSALLKRWRAECCGNPNGSIHHDDDNVFARDGKKRKQTTISMSQQAANKRYKPNKRSTGMVTMEENSTDNDDEQSVDSYAIVEDDDDDDNSVGGRVLSKKDLVLGGLRVSRALAKAKLRNEFISWSCEAREAFVDSAITALLTTAAMAPSGDMSRPTTSNDSELDLLRRKVPSSLSEALKRCFPFPSVDDALGDTSEQRNSEYERAERNHETAVAILRGVFPSLVLQVELPNGHKGKEAAHAISLSTVEGITELVAKHYERSVALSPTTTTTPKTPSVQARTPTLTRTTAASATTTPGSRRSSRKKRVSFGGLDTVSSGDMVPPSLKHASTPVRSLDLGASGLTPIQGNTRPRPVLSAILGMLQKLATFKGLDRANTRSHIIDTLCTSLPCLPLLERTCFLRFLIHLCHSKVAAHRLMCVDLVGKILSKAWLWREHSSQSVSPIIENSPTTMTPSTRASFSPIVECSAENMPLALLRIIQGRLVDRTPAVRARAAYALSVLLQSISERNGMESDNETDLLAEFGMSLDVVANDFARKLHKRAALDDGATVRKAAINAIADLFVFNESTQSLCSEADVSMLSALCSDTSVAVRKAAADSLTTLLLHFSGAEFRSRDLAYVLQETWPTAVIPMVGDIEPTCVAKAIDLFYQATIEPLIQVNVEDLSTESSLPSEYFAAWRLLSQVRERSVQEGADRREFDALRSLIGKLSELYDGEVMRRLLIVTREVAIRSLEKQSDTLLECNKTESQLRGSWCLLEAIADQGRESIELSKLKKKQSFSFSFLAGSLNKLVLLLQSSRTDSIGTINSALKSCMKILSKWAKHLEIEDAKQLSDNLKHLLRIFELPTDLVGSKISALVAVTDRVYDDQTKRQCTAWIIELYESCEDFIASFVASSYNSSNEETKLVRALFSTGELSMIGFRADEDVFPSNRTTQSSQVSASFDTVVGLHEPPSNRLLSLVQAMLAKVLPKSDRSTPESARAHAFLALGKLCLRSEALAKKSLTLLVQELHQNDGDMSPSVQSNALLVLGDLCVRYTNLVDRYLPVMARCLQSGITNENKDTLFDVTADKTSLVRKHAVLLLSGLLLQDYIKWRGLLFQRFLVATTDRDEGVARLAEMMLCGPLLKKYPKLFFNNFVESLFVLNQCTAHPLHAAAASAGDNGGGVTVGFEGINLTGETGRAARNLIYGTAIATMSDEEKIGITARLANDVLGAALETSGDFSRVCRNPSSSFTSSDENAFNVLSDAFFILTSPALQVSRVPSRENADWFDDPSAESKARHVAAAKGNLLSKISRKQLVEMVLPILCNLKTMLQESCSPLLKDLMMYLVVIFRAYKVEVKEFLASDPTLLQEIEYDARQFKKAQRLSTPSGRIVVLCE